MKQMPVKEVQTDKMETTSASPRAHVPAMVRGLWWKTLCGLLMAATIIIGLVVVGPANPVFNFNGHGAKIIFFHVPCAWMASLAYIVGAWYAVGALRGRQENDFKCASAMELGFLFAI